MKVLFLIGGAGNVYFELLNLKKEREVFVSDFFITPFIRKILGHTNHPKVYNELFNTSSSCWSYLMLPVLFLDVFLLKFFKLTFFSRIDLRSLKSIPIITESIYLGYFQDNVELLSIRNSNKIIKSDIIVDSKLKNKNVIHIRGGDFIKYSSCIEDDYYAKSLAHFNDINEFLIVTNDVGYAKKITSKYFYDKKIEITCSDEVTDYQILHHAKNLICSNSTFALTAALSGKNIRRLILPKEFKKKLLYSDIINDIEIVFI